jgi:hypothetical protein
MYIEQWKPIDGFENYEISDKGRIRSIVKRTNTYVGKLLKPYIDRDGYWRIVLFRLGFKYPRHVHKLVAAAFIPNPYGLPEVNHKDTIRSNSSASNLEWRTGLGNKRHSVKLRIGKSQGTSFDKARGKWRAYYQAAAGQRIYLGCTYPTQAEAQVARDRALEELPNVI